MEILYFVLLLRWFFYLPIYRISPFICRTFLTQNFDKKLWCVLITWHTKLSKFFQNIFRSSSPTTISTTSTILKTKLGHYRTRYLHIHSIGPLTLTVLEQQTVASWSIGSSPPMDTSEMAVLANRSSYSESVTLSGIFICHSQSSISSILWNMPGGLPGNLLRDYNWQFDSSWYDLSDTLNGKEGWTLWEE